MRANDFLVGYEAMAVWLLGGLPKRGVEPKAATAALQAVSDRAMTIPGWTGGLAVGRRTSLRTRIDVLRVGLRAVGIGLRRGADPPRV